MIPTEKKLVTRAGGGPINWGRKWGGKETRRYHFPDALVDDDNSNQTKIRLACISNNSTSWLSTFCGTMENVADVSR